MTSVSQAVYLYEVDVWNGSAVETWYMSTKTKSTRPTDTPANTEYRGLIIDAGQVDRQITFRGAALETPSYSPVSVRLDNLANNFTPWIDPDSDYALDGREYRLKQLSSPDLPVDAATLLMRGTVRGIDASDVLRSITVLGTDKLATLARPLLTARYAGTTTSLAATAEGDETLAQQIKPLVLGVALNVMPKLVNRFYLIYQVSIAAVVSIAAYDGRLPLDNMGDHPNLAALTEATLVVGQYATCFALGLFRVGGAPEKTLTADVVEGATAAVRSASRICQRVLTLLGISSGSTDTASFDAFHSFDSSEVGIYIDADTDALSILNQIAGSVLGTIIPSDSGVYQAVWLTDPALAAYSDTLTLRDIGVDGASFSYLLGADEDNTGIPGWRVVANWGRNWHVMGGGDIFATVDAATRALYTNPTGWRQASPAGAQSAAVLAAHPLAMEFTVDTLLATQAAAEAQAVTRFNLVSRKRAKIVTPINFDRATPAIGSVIRLRDSTHPLLAAGRNYIVLGRKDDLTRRSRYLKLWG